MGKKSKIQKVEKLNKAIEDKLHDAMYDIYLTKAIFDIVCSHKS